MLQIKNNELKTREDALQALDQLIRPLQKYFVDHQTQLDFGHTGSRTVSRTAAMEGVLRPLWGLAPSAAGGCDSDLWAHYREAITYGTDPSSPYYFGDVTPFDQKMVEMAPIGFALAIAADKIYEPLSDHVKENFVNWMNQINEHDLPDNNWRFFVVFVNIGLKSVGAPYNPERLERELVRLEEFYLEDGWYSDGVTHQRDYYVSFAIHFYGLIYCKLVPEDTERCERFISRSKVFARTFIYWFGSEGDALPYGRSLTYRFAQVSYFSAVAYADIDIMPLGALKGIIFRHLRSWFASDIFHKDGVLSLGYKYENLHMTEGYNATGSPYWALKAFVFLGLPEDHPFWQVEEEPLPELDPIKVLPHPYMVIAREDSSHLAAFTGGQYAAFEPAHMECKYEKFVYSNIFGFSVPKGHYGLEQGAFDNMLALSEEGDYYRGRHNATLIELSEDLVVADWNPWKDVVIRTWLIPGLPWHLRIHRINSDRPLQLAEGGYAIPREDEKGRTIGKKQSEGVGILLGAEAINHPTSAIYGLVGYEEARWIQPEANTNLIHPRTYIPMLSGSMKAGEQWLISAVYGSKSNNEMDDRPMILKDEKGVIKIKLFSEKEVHVDKQTGIVTVLNIKIT